MKEKRLEFLSSLQKLEAANLSGQVKILSDESDNSSSKSPREKPKKSFLRIPTRAIKSNNSSNLAQSKESVGQKSKETPRTERENNPVEEPENYYRKTAESGLGKYKSSAGLSKLEELKDAETVVSKSISSDHKSTVRPIRKLYTKADIAEMERKRTEAAIAIQRYYRARLQREKFQLLIRKKMQSKDNMIIKRKILILTPYRTVNGQEVPLKPDDFHLVVVAVPQQKKLRFSLTNNTERTKFDLVVPIDHLPLNYDPSSRKKGDPKNEDIIVSALHKHENRDIIDQFIESTIKRIHIVDHLVYLKDEPESSPSKQQPIVFKNEEATAEKSNLYMISFNSKEQPSQPLYAKVPNYKTKEGQITLIQAIWKGKQAREMFKLMKQRGWRFLHQCELSIDGYWISLKVIQMIAENEVYVIATRHDDKKNSNRLVVPQKLRDMLKENYGKIVDCIDFDMNNFEIKYRINIEIRINPEFRKKCLREYDIPKIISIQKNIRRYLARIRYELMLEKERRTPGKIFLRKWPYIFENYVIRVSLFYFKEGTYFYAHAASMGEHVEIKDLKIPLNDVDKGDFADKLVNIKRLGDILISYVNFTRKGKDIYLQFDKKKYERDSKKAASSIMRIHHMANSLSGEIVDMDDNGEARKKIREFILEKFLLKQAHHNWKRILGLQKTVNLKVNEDTTISNFAEEEESAAKKIQRCFRRWVSRKNLHQIGLKKEDPTNQNTISEVLAHSLQEKTNSLFSKCAKRFSVTDDELRKKSTSNYIFLRSVLHKFSNTHIDCKIIIYYNKVEKDDKKIELEILFPILGKIQYIVIHCFNIATPFKKTIFMKKMDELLLDRLDFNKATKEVVYVPEREKPKTKLTKLHEKSKFMASLRAKMLRVRQRRKKDSSNIVLKTETTRLTTIFVTIIYTWVPYYKQLWIEASRVDKPGHVKKFIVKFSRIGQQYKLYNLIRDTLPPSVFIQRMAPYVEYIAKSIKVEETNYFDIDDKDTFKLLIDQSDYDLEVAGNSITSAYLNGLPKNFEKDLTNAGINKLLAKKQTQFVDCSRVESQTERQESKMIDTKLELNESAIPHAHDDRIITEKTAGEEEEEGDHSPNYKGYIDSEIIEARINHLRKLSKKELAQAALIIQKHFRAYQDRQKMRLMKMAKAHKKRVSLYGKLVKRGIRKIENTYYIIHVYRRDIPEQEARSYFFTALPMRDQYTDKKIREAKGSFRADKTMLLNSEGLTLEDFLLNKLDIVGNNIEFNFYLESEVNYVNVEKLKSPKRLLSNITRLPSDENAPDKQANQANPSDKKDSPQGSLAQIADAEEGKDQVHELNKPEADKKPKKLTIIAKSRNDEDRPTLTMSKVAIMSEGEAGENDVEEQEIMLLQQRAETLSDNVLLYNVFYNNQIDELNLVDALIPSKEKHISPTAATENVIKLEIDMNELKKYAPMVEPKSAKDLQALANEITKSIHVNEKGELLVNSIKLNPNAISLQTKKMNLTKFDESNAEAKKHDKRKVLFKTTRLFREKKYLLIITYIERPSNLNKIIVAHEGNDQVYEEYDLFLDISATCISHKNLKPLTWELPLQECQKYSGKERISDIAKFFAENIHIFADKFLLSTPFKCYAHTNNVIVMYEGSIKILQQKFRTRQFAKNFENFKRNVKEVQQYVMHRSIVNIATEYYHVLALSKNNGSLEIQAWDTYHYSKLELHLEIKPLEKYLGIDKKRTIDLIFRYLGLELSKQGNFRLILREKNLLDALLKEFF